LILRNLAVAATMTTLWLLADFVDVKIARLPSVEYELPILLVAVFVAFVSAGRSTWAKLPAPRRWVAIAGVAGILTAVWFAVSVAIVLQFHLLIGGGL
jgi:hypothetical protein